MELKKLAVTIAVISMPFQFIGQHIIQTFEKDQDGRSYDKNLNKKDAYKNQKIVDINSIIEINLNTTALLDDVNSHVPLGLPDEFTAKLIKLREAAEKRRALLKELNEVTKTYNYEDFKTDSNAAVAYAAKLQAPTQLLVDIINIDPQVRTEYIKSAGKEFAYEAVFTAAARVLKQFESEIKMHADAKGVQVQFGAWLYSQGEMHEVHLPGFDDIAPQQLYEVPRWQFMPSPVQKEEIGKLKTLAKENKDTGLSLLRSSAKNQLEAIKSFGNNQADLIVANLKAEVNSITTAAPLAIDQSLVEFIKDIDTFETEFKTFTDELNNRLEYYKGIQSLSDFQLPEFLSHALADNEFITKNKGKEVLDKIVAIGIQFEALDEGVKASAGNVGSQLNDLKSKYSEAFDSIKRFATSNINAFIQGEKLDLALFEFSEKVYKLSLTELPESTELDLTTAGPRIKGDRIVLKLNLLKRASTNSIPLDSRVIYLFRVLPHIETTAGIIYADPLYGANISRDFQMAPFYNIMFKGVWDQKKRRKSVVYNRLLEWSWGLHIAAPDFDKDDVPEIGAGLVLSGLGDYIQTGVGFNVFVGEAYWYFGLKVPIIGTSIGQNGAGN